MTAKIDMTEQTYGKWKVISMAESTFRGEARANVQCMCGNTSVVRCNLLRNGTSTQCRACAAVERAKNTVSPKMNDNKAAIIAWHKKQERESEQWILTNYYMGY